MGTLACAELSTARAQGSAKVSCPREWLKTPLKLATPRGVGLARAEILSLTTLQYTST